MKVKNNHRKNTEIKTEIRLIKQKKKNTKQTQNIAKKQKTQKLNQKKKTKCMKTISVNSVIQFSKNNP